MSARPVVFLQLRAGSLYPGQVVFFAKNPITYAECLSASFQEVQKFASRQRLMIDLVVDEYFRKLDFITGKGWSIKSQFLEKENLQWSAVEYLEKLQADNF